MMERASIVFLLVPFYYEKRVYILNIWCIRLFLFCVYNSLLVVCACVCVADCIMITNKQNKLDFLIQCCIINALSTVQFETHVDWIYNEHMHIYTVKYNTRAHIHRGCHFDEYTVYFLFMHTHIYTCVGILSGSSHITSFHSGVRLLSFMKCPQVAPQLTHVSSAFTFCPIDCDATFLSSMESKAGSCVIDERSLHWATGPEPLCLR